MYELKHYGVLGMKWGVRKKETKSQRATRKAYNRADAFNKFAESMGSKDRISYDEKNNVYEVSGRSKDNYKDTKSKSISPLVGSVLYDKTQRDTRVNKKDIPSQKNIDAQVNKIEREVIKMTRAGDEKRKIRKFIGQQLLRLNRVTQVIDMNIYGQIGRIYALNDKAYRDFYKQRIDQVNDNYRQAGEELMRDGKYLSTMMKTFFT